VHIWHQNEKLSNVTICLSSNQQGLAVTSVADKATMTAKPATKIILWKNAPNLFIGLRAYGGQLSAT
jgi:hypothetical protein